MSLTVDEFALDQIDSTDGIDGTEDDAFSEPIEFNDAIVLVFVKLGLTGFTGFAGQSILSLFFFQISKTVYKL